MEPRIEKIPNIKILHITESFGGGVVSAIKTYIAYRDGCEHHLLAKTTDFAKVDDAFQKDLVSFDMELSGDFLKARQQVKAKYDEVRPDIVHLHSSFAGLYGRVAGIPSEKIIYTPHGYAFQRKDISWPLRASFYLAELVLTKITKASVIAACGPGEYDAALKLSDKVTLLPNHADVSDTVQWNGFKDDDYTVCMVGRISRQKDPGFFIETLKRVEKIKEGLPVRFLWIGEGDVLLREELLANGVEITGWLDSKSVLDTMAESSIYFHTAAWDGLPLTLLEASKVGMPLVIRETEATHFLSGQTCESPQEAAEEIVALLQEEKSGDEKNRLLNTMFTQEKMFSVLDGLYKRPFKR